MSSDIIAIRWPTGVTEFRLGETKPKVGDVLQQNGDKWLVVTVEQQSDGTAAVTLRPLDGRAA